MDTWGIDHTLNFSLLIFFYLLLVWKAGKTYPLLYLFIFIYYLQYIFSPYLIYNNYKQLRDQMPITEEQYFDYTLPALMFLFAGVILFNKDFNLRALLRRIQPGKAADLGILLLVISYCFDAFGLLGIDVFNSIISFTTYLKYLAAFCFLFSDSKWRYMVIGVVYVHLALSVLGGGVFVSFFIWSTFLFFFAILRFKWSFWLRAGFILLAVPVVILVQSVKKEYRQMTWQGNQQGGVGLFRDLAVKEGEESADQPFEKTTGVIRTVARLNQGWHLGLTMQHVPSKEPFADGAEISNDIFSSILPRMIFTDKKVVNSQDKFAKYTGHVLRGHTSMSIGLLGDFYINFGREGSFFWLFVFGGVIALLIRFFIRRYVFSDPINIVWIPFFLSYLIRANNDFYIFFNCMVKGFIVFLLVNFLRHQVFVVKRRKLAISRPAGS